MGSRPRSYMGTPVLMRKTARRRPNPHRRACKIQHSSSTRIRAGACVSEKLEALKNLIPVHTDHGEIKPDQLFQETADYIVLLRTQISVLQNLVDVYGSSAGQAQPHRLAAV
ncbi:unnamed protein product [Coffea canephora]|uniref:BHLH domain-containing protein n=1 Tax=Coffea canephora TaxID=49390 RepID=A0A068U1X7_COFCA|nr:unnamed protein product [Coffea canephora]